MLLLRLLIVISYDVAYSTDQVLYKHLNESDPLYWYTLAKRTLGLRQHLVPLANRPVKNVVLFLGDGLGVSTITASRILKGQLGRYHKEEAVLDFDQFPHSALIKTYNVDQLIPDSAATATAFLSGIKTRFYTIGVSPKVLRDDPDCDSVRRNSVQSIFSWAIDSGKVAGLVTNARVTHATPAAAYAHTQNRKWESNVNESVLSAYTGLFPCKDIALQLIEDNPGRQLSVILGGGRKGFLPSNHADPRGIHGDDREKFGERNDGRNLIEEWLNARRDDPRLNDHSEYAFVNSTRGLREVNFSKVKYLLGLFNYTHMEFDRFRDKSLDGEPSLSEMTRAAIRILSKHPEGFMLMVEGGLIDQAHHQGYATLSLYETLELNRAIKVAREMAEMEDTLIVVTADHSQPLVINGYSSRHDPIIGTSKRTDLNRMPFTTLMYANGPGYQTMAQRSKLNNSVLEEKSLHDLKYQYHSAIPLKKSHHAGEDVALFSIGPMSHLFGGTMEQSYIAHAISFATCIGPYQNERHCKKNSFLLDVASYNRAAVQIIYWAILFTILAILITFFRLASHSMCYSIPSNNP